MTARSRLGAGLPVLVPAVLVAALASGCGGSGGTPQASPSDTGSPTPTATASVSPTASATPTATSAPTSSAPAYPACTRVWVAGQRLHGRYLGCTAPDGRVVRADNRHCVVGHDLETYANRFFAQETGKIFTSGDVSHDPRFAEAISLCRHP